MILKETDKMYNCYDVAPKGKKHLPTSALTPISKEIIWASQSTSLNEIKVDQLTLRISAKNTGIKGALKSAT